MIHTRALPSLSCALLACGAFACSAAKPTSTDLSPSGSEVAVSVVSGALNNNSGSGVAWNPQPPKSSAMDRALAFLNPIGTAYAASWSCSGDTLSPTFDGSAGHPYAFTPASCSVTWGNGLTASSDWSGPFTLVYSGSCDATHPFMELQAGGCELTRTSGASGDRRTITGPDGNSYAIDHDTNGAGTGWDPTVTPVPNDSGVQVTCGAGGCASSRTLMINGSHLTGTVTVGGVETTIWDHTVTSGGDGITVSGAGADRTVSGTVIVQHNLLRYVSTTTFESVGYGEPLCCFPTRGSVTTTFSSGANVGKTESIAFTAACGEAMLTKPDGQSVALTFEHCL
jgi:hypothetical protein